MHNQDDASSKDLITAEQAMEPLLGGKENGNEPVGASIAGNGSSVIVFENGSGANAKTVTILHPNEDKSDNNSNKYGGRASAARHPIAVAPPPDGGWGWIVVFSSFTISMLVDGVCFSFGIFFDEFRHEFGSSKAATSWIGSVLNGTYLAIGPIVSALVNVYGCKKVVVAGALLSSAAFFVSSYSNTLGVVILTWGFLGGFGFGLMYLPAIVMVGYYFERRRALATGIACCGSGIGAFCFAPLCELMLTEYGWRGASWIISGLVLNGMVCALFYKPLTAEKLSFHSADATDSAITMITECETVSGSHALHPSCESTVDAKPPLPGKPLDSKDQGCLDEIKPIQVHRPRSATVDAAYSTPIDDINRLTRSTDLSLLVRRHSAASSQRKYCKNGQASDVVFGSTVDVTYTLSPLQRKDIFYSGSLSHLKQYQELPTRQLTEVKPNTHDKSSNNSLFEETTFTSDRSFSMAIASVFDFSLLKSPTFMIYGFSCFFCMAGFFVPFIYLPTHAIGLGLSSLDGASLISIIGITNTVGRVIVGFVSDQTWADCLIINNVALVIGGVATSLAPFYPSYLMLAVYSAVFGSAIAVFVSLRSIIMVELMGLERLTSAFGLVIMFQGISAFIGAPIAGEHQPRGIR
ncbi:monocarboxylate transporter [Plakobranchus ocellatus]|uniref:Monocarboxylate transporter n=1 Tax=Plakobranchus ocellatus TaxID=259542 RepID=A0AAV4ANR1_9GAST|nr:monocarboxylate transporter [Plakobranchus ocellatus]